MLVQAKTGTGKTLAFLIPIVERLARGKPSTGISALILSPTRELALQIQKEALALIKHHPNFTVDSIIGGTKCVFRSIFRRPLF